MNKISCYRHSNETDIHSLQFIEDIGEEGAEEIANGMAANGTECRDGYWHHADGLALAIT